MKVKCYAKQLKFGRYAQVLLNFVSECKVNEMLPKTSTQLKPKVNFKCKVNEMLPKTNTRIKS